MTDTVTIVVLMLLVALRVLVICTAAWLFVPKRRHCPHCASVTMALVSPSWMLRLRLHRRWCTCGWAGWSKAFEWRPPEDGEVPTTGPHLSPGRGQTLPADPSSPRMVPTDDP